MGYKQPPEHCKFKKGQAPGPGRPKGLPSSSTIIRQLLEQEEKGDDGEVVARAYKMHDAQIRKAITGDTPAYSAVLTRYEGAPTVKYEEVAKPLTEADEAVLSEMRERMREEIRKEVLAELSEGKNDKS